MWIVIAQSLNLTLSKDGRNGLCHGKQNRNFWSASRTWIKSQKTFFKLHYIPGYNIKASWATRHIDFSDSNPTTALLSSFKGKKIKQTKSFYSLYPFYFLVFVLCLTHPKSLSLKICFNHFFPQEVPLFKLQSSFWLYHRIIDSTSTTLGETLGGCRPSHGG